jgi:ketosteroid isomerase-like protein
MRRLLAPIILTVAATSPAAAQCSNAEKQTLEAIDHAWSEATTRGDRAQLQSIIADDYEGATITGTVYKASTIDDAVRAAERNRTNPQAVPKTAYGGYVITCTPNSAVVTHLNTITATVNGREQTTYSRSVHVFEKRAGRWQVVGNAGHPLTDASLVLYMESAWNDAIKSHDAGWVERNYADDATDISRTGEMQNKASAIAAMKSDKSTVESIELSEMSTRVDGNTAVVTGVFRERGRGGQGNQFDRRVRFTDTWIKRDGRWQVWASQGTLISP